MTDAEINELVQKCRPTPEDAGTLGTVVPMGFEAVQELVTKLVCTLAPITSSSLARLLGKRVSQEWKPERETPRAPHIQTTGQTVRCLAMTGVRQTALTLIRLGFRRLSWPDTVRHLLAEGALRTRMGPMLPFPRQR